jgi:hypothetical protein
MESKSTEDQLIFFVNVIYYALLTGILLFALVAVLFAHVLEIDFGLGDETGLFVVIFSILSLSSLFGSIYISNIRDENLKGIDNHEKRVQEFRVSFLIRFVILEFSAITAIMGYMLTGSVILLFLVALTIYFFYSNRPDVHQIKQTLNAGSRV